MNIEQSISEPSKSCIDPLDDPFPGIRTNQLLRSVVRLFKIRSFISLGNGISTFLLFFLFSACSKPPEKPSIRDTPIRNVLIISIDTLRADALSIYGNRVRSDFFENFASRSIVFDRAFTPVPITLPAHTSLLTGLYPPTHGVRNNGTFRASPELHLLSETAQQQGMATAAFLGAFPLASQFGLNQGFQTYDDTFSSAAESTSFLYAERSAEQVRLSAQSWLSLTGRKPFFVWMHFFDPHHPYLTHDRSTNPPYLQEVLYVDQQLGLFFDFLSSRNLLANTLVVLTSDHGEAFGEHGEVSHSIFVYNTTLHVPLIIAAPGFQARKCSDVARLIDIYTTVFELMKWPATTNKVDGRSLVPLLRGETLPPAESYAETLAPALDFGWSPLFSLQNNKTKYIEAPKPEIYNLQQDPKEERNLIGTMPIEQYRSKLQTILKEKRTAVSAPALSQEDREKLESLGYLSSGSQRPQNSSVNPKDRIEIARQIANLSINDSTLEEKAKAYQKLLETESSNPLLLLRYAEILLKLKRFADAGAVFKKVITLGYASAAPYNGLASVYFQQDQILRAKEVLESAVEKTLADGETYYNLAEFYLSEGDQEKALRFYNASIQFDFQPAFDRKTRLLEMNGKKKTD